MHAATYEAFFNELSQIEKDAGVGDIFRAGTKALKSGVGKANTLAVRGVARAQTHPIGKHVVNHLLDPNNIPDMARSLGTLFGH